MVGPYKDFPGSVGGATSPTVSAPFSNSGIISYHSVNSAIVVYPAAAFSV